MDIEKAKINLHELQYELKLEQEENIKKHGYNPEQEIEAIDVVLNELEKYEKQLDLDYVENELDKKDKIINEMAKWIEKHTGYAIDETLYKESKEYIIDYFTKEVEGK